MHHRLEVMAGPTEPSPAASAVRFQLGHVVVTPGALESVRLAGQSVSDFLSRHRRGDWGDLGLTDAKLNDEAVAHEDNEELRTRVLSAYRTALNDRLWIISEADRSASTILLPEEY